MRTRTLVITALVGTSLTAVTIFQAKAIGSGTAAPATSPGASPAAAIARRVAAEGRIVAYPGAEVKVAAERGGRLLRVLVEEGQSVRKGSVLAEIESDELRAARDEARARMAEAEAEIRLAQLNRGRREQLVKQNVVAVHDLDQATRDLEIAQARRETARAEAARLDAQIRQTHVVAPISGTVVARSVDPGETVETGDALVTIADLGRLRVEGEADEADAAALALGATVDITADGYPGQTWSGRIEDVADSVTLRRIKPQDPSRPTDTRVISVMVAFGEPNPLRLGTTVDLAITAPTSEARATVPNRLSQP
jgi:RND family efflux transporter MFP subunit